MNISERKQGYGYLIDWIIRLGDLFIINSFFLTLYTVFRNSDLLIDHLRTGERLVTVLMINLCYFLVTSFIRLNISTNVVFLEKIVQRSTLFIVIYSITITAGLSILNIISIPIVPWLIGFNILAILIIGWHISFRLLLKNYRRRGYNFKEIIIVGGGINGREIYKSLKGSDYGYKILGFFDDDILKKEVLPKYLGSIEDIYDYCKYKKVDGMFCTLPGREEDKITELIAFCENNMIRFHLVPEYHKYIKRKFSLQFIEATPVLGLRYEPLQYFSNRFVKRSFDILFSSFVLIFIFPFIYLIFGAIIKFTSPGPVFFKQKRTGIKGKEFYCYKFRSMRPNKEANSLQATKKDPRVTKVGAFMRKTSVDELPQFINVIKGEMSVVGPRPHMLQHTELYSSVIDKFMVRHLVKPGITGWAQVTGFRGETKTVEEMEERVRRDVWYLENWSFFVDMKIIYMTIANVFKGENNAY